MKFMYLRLNKSTNPRVTVAYMTVSEANGPQAIQFGYAIRAPNDPWNRNRARLIAEGRMFASMVRAPKEPTTKAPTQASGSIPLDTTPGNPPDQQILDALTALPDTFMCAATVRKYAKMVREARTIRVVAQSTVSAP